jgi:divalent metal cation (Fe/Co/Zn/Cd) transporter
MGAAMIRHMIARLVGYFIALVLLTTAFGFLVATLYLALAKPFEEPVAALLTALALGAVAGLILLIGRPRRPRKPVARAVEADALLLSVTDQVRRDPWLALGVAAVLGALAEIARPSSDRPPR